MLQNSLTINFVFTNYIKNHDFYYILKKKIIRLNKAIASKRCTQDQINFAVQNIAAIDEKVYC